MIKTSNNKAREYVESRKPFKGNNTFGEGDDNLYIVYSYGYHHPLLVWNGYRWFENNTKVSVSTSKHLSQLKPSLRNIVSLPIKEIKNLI